MQENRCPGFVSNVMDVVSIVSSLRKHLFVKQLLKLLFQAQPANDFQRFQVFA